MRQETQHIDEQELSAFVEGELGPDEFERIDTHLATCEQCAGARAEIESTVAMLSELSDEITVPNLVGGVERRIRRRSRGRFFERGGWSGNNKITYIAAAVIIALLVALYFLTQMPYTLHDAEQGDEVEAVDELGP